MNLLFDASCKIADCIYLTRVPSNDRASAADGLEKGRRHLRNNRFKMGLGQVGVPSGLTKRLVPEQGRDIHERCSGHGEVRCGAVSEVMPSEVGDAYLLESFREGVPQVDRLQSIPTREDELCVQPAYLGMVLQEGQRGISQGYHTQHAVLGVAEGEPSPAQIDITPGQGEQFHFAATCRQAQDYDNVEQRIATRLTGDKQPLSFVIGQVAGSARR